MVPLKKRRRNRHYKESNVFICGLELKIFQYKYGESLNTRIILLWRQKYLKFDIRIS